MSTPRVHVSASDGTFGAEAARLVAEGIDAALASGGRCAVALAGGTTPRSVYRALAARCAPAPWPGAVFWFGDERCVSPRDARSNYRMACESLFDPAGIGGDRVRRIRGEAPDPDVEAAAYAESMPDRFDVMLLGVGEDGHIASLFPGSAACAERRRKAVAVHDAPAPPRRRITVTPRVIESAARLFVLVAGAAKAPAVARSLEDPRDPERTPAQFARSGTWILDPGAASALGQPGGTP